MSTNAKIQHRIQVLEEEFGDTINNLGKQAELGNATADRWTDNQIEKPTAAVKQFLSYWGISPEWWKTGRGEVFLTSGDKTAENQEKPKDKSDEERIDGLIADLRENNRYLQGKLDQAIASNERLQGEMITALRAANDHVSKLTTVALGDSKK